MPTELSLVRPEDAAGTARAILSMWREARVFAFEGPLGAGKTTLIKALCRQLGVHGGMASPSFGIVNEYVGREGEPIYHFDLYRLRNAQELEGIGFVEYVDSGRYCFMEWPGMGMHLLPPGTVYISIAPLANGTRTLSISMAPSIIHPA